MRETNEVQLRFEIADKLVQNDIKREDLKRCSLFDLRIIGRCSLIQSAVAMKKDQLINAILDVKSGEGAIYIPETNKGKKPSAMANIDHVLNNLIDETRSRRNPKETLEEKIAEKESLVIEDSGSENFSFARVEDRGGYLEIGEDEHGYLRGDSLKKTDSDVFVHKKRIAAFNLKEGDYIFGSVGLNAERVGMLVQVHSVNGISVVDALPRKEFFELTPIYPMERFDLSESSDLALRVIDLLAPIGKGQRALIGAPLNSNKSSLLKNIAVVIAEKYASVKMLAFFTGERPEEITDFQKKTGADVFYPDDDDSAERKIVLAELVSKRAKRLLEKGEDVVLFVDSLTMLAFINNSYLSSSGQRLENAIEAEAMSVPKSIFESARNIEEGGSLTVIALALVDSFNSGSDNRIFEELEISANMELYISKNLVDKRMPLAIDFFKTETRNDEYLLTERELCAANKLRGILNEKTGTEKTDVITTLFGNAKSKEELLLAIEKI